MSSDIYAKDMASKSMSVMFGTNGGMALWNPVGVQVIVYFKAQGAQKAGTLGFGVQRLRRNRLPSSMICSTRYHLK